MSLNHNKIENLLLCGKVISSCGSNKYLWSVFFFFKTVHYKNNTSFMLQCVSAVIILCVLTISRDEFYNFKGAWPSFWEKAPCHVSTTVRRFPAASRTDRAGISWSSGGGPRHWPPCYYLPLHSEVREKENERHGHQTHDDKHIDAGSPSLPAQHFCLNPGAKHAAGLTVGTQSAKRHQKPSSTKYHYGL